jgi:simple sugar transport system ATP-binding protein
MAGRRNPMSADGQDAERAAGETPLLSLAHISKRFPGVIANDDVSLSIRAGEIHALLGENGAGKSTLVKIIYGVQRADEGEIRWKGERVTIASPRAARRLGIGMVFQHFSLFEAMTVLENVALGLDAPPDDATLARRIAAILETYSLPLDPTREVHTLSVGERQRVEIVRCLMQDPDLLIMDEPTSVLTPQEAERLFETLRTLAREGKSVLYISHKLDEIKALCDRATIMRAGRVVAEIDPRAGSTRRMAELMIGADLKDVARRPERAAGPVRLAVENLTVPSDDPFGVDLDHVSFEARGGEILGIAGVAGNGQGELLLALAGEARAPAPQTIRLDGAAIGHAGPAARRRLGLNCVPEERNGHAAVPDFSLTENAILTARERIDLVRSGFIRSGAAGSFVKDVIASFGVKATGTGAAARSLSGGNLQKFVVGREIMQAPGVLVVSQPTWGVDAGAAAAIRQALVDLSDKGSAIVVISQDLDELLALSDRLVVINAGRLSRPLDPRGATIEEIGLLMGGVHGETPHATEAGHAASA